VSINLPIVQPVPYSTHSSTVYGPPGAQIMSIQKVPRTVCRAVWPGSTTQQCSTEYVTVEERYVPPPPVYVPAPVYVNPSVTFGYPGYGHNYQLKELSTQHSEKYRPAGPPPITIYNTHGPSYGIGTYGHQK
jgi:hypothetical protein